MKIGVVGKKGLAGLQLSLLILSLFSFSFILYSLDVVSGAGEDIMGRPDQGYVPADDINLPSRFAEPGYTDPVLGSTAGARGFGVATQNVDLTSPASIGGAGTVSGIGTPTAAINVLKLDVPTSKNYFSSMLKLEAGGIPDALVTGLAWAAGAYYFGTMFGDMLGLTDKNSEALGTSLAAGTFAYQALTTYTTAGEALVTGAQAGWIGIAVAAVVFAVMYKDVDTKVVEFSCMPWQAPVGGNNCGDCNDADLACSEYRCKSLGQGCGIVNEGTAEEKCVYINPRDVNPPVISPNRDELSADHSYTDMSSSPPSPGFTIVNENSRDGCLEAFTPLEFGITVDEPAQCKIDYNSTASFDDMVAYVGGSNSYAYNHSEVFNFPGASEMQEGGFVLENGKDLTFFMRCKDKNGNENLAEYAVNFCVDPSPDTTAPRIEATSVMNGGCVAEGVSDAEVAFYVNEPASCRWSTHNYDYDLMENDMRCSITQQQINAAQLFRCMGTLSGIPRDGANYYIRCKDAVGDGNEMRESFEFNLRGSTGLLLVELRPNETVYGGVSPAPIELYVETLFGCNDGRAVCQWSDDGSNYIEFDDTNNEDGIHTQRLNLIDGAHDYYVKCIDEGGNLIEEVVQFEVDIDTTEPVVARIYEEDGMLKIITVLDSECSYSLDNCDFSLDDGTEMPYGNTTIHIAEWESDNTYYIKCRDEFLNEGAGCSVVVHPTENFL